MKNNEIENYFRIINYDFSDIFLSDKVAVKFKIKSRISPYDFLTLFISKKGERFAIKRPNKKEIIIGIGHEVTYGFDSNDFLKNYENTVLIDEFQSLSNQTTFIEIDKLEQEYFGIYGGLSDGDNRKSQEWIDFRDTLFVVPSILAVFKEDEIEFVLFFNLKKSSNFITEWKNRIAFLLNINNHKLLELEEPKIKMVRDIYPEIWQNNIKLSLKEIENNNFERIALSRKNQILLEDEASLPAVVKYFINKKLSFIGFESQKSIFITSNPLLSMSISDNNINAYVYLQKENLFNGNMSINFENDDVEEYYKNKLEEVTGYEFSITKDKTLVGKNLDIYTVFSAKGNNNKKDLKILSMLYPVTIIKGYPYDITSKFLKDNENIGYGFWYGPFGFINKNLEANFYTCGNMIVSFSNILTIFTSILINKELNYKEIIENSNNLLEKNLRLFNVENY